MPITNSTQRFSTRVENYIKYRPHYPPAVVDLLRRECGLSPGSFVADIGSGTGILTKLLLSNGNPVFGIEPNKEMREAAERLLGNYPKFHSVTGTAEATTLPDQSVDIITAGQAFHWFQRNETRAEFVRILKPNGWLALIWNDRNIADRPFFKDYENLLVTYGTDYEAVGSKHVDDKIIGDFFAPGVFQRQAFPNQQEFDFDGLKGRLLSSSYAPEPGHPKYAPMVESLLSIFEEYQSGGKVIFEYDATVYYGQLAR